MKPHVEHQHIASALRTLSDKGGAARIVNSDYFTLGDDLGAAQDEMRTLRWRLRHW